MFIATLIAAESIAERDISEAVAHMTPLCEVADWNWIDEGRAADIFFSEDADWAAGVLHGRFHHVDVVIQPAAHRAKRLLVADMDSTMITVECIDELADYAGIKEQVAEVTERAMRGELDFAAALDARVALLEGLDESVIEQCLAERVKLMAGARALVRTMKARGGHAILVSGGFTRFAEPVAAEIGFDRAIANYLEIAHGKLTGTVRKPIVGSDTKEKTLLAALDELGIGAAESMAVGDGANDLAMIRRAGLGVAYRAKPIVAGAAAARIDHGDLTALLYAQGIPSAEWVTA
ncbi:phosphoserine phosphatase SerB [Sphingomonas sanguinis]|uniref:Phosphoserine phosphatase n=1 Tax=Sphingomonas sanguinis TaxID=33051 RepID=A0A147JAX4_9SPHN|nr:phosphoserine phosphatase SerB [Sphingomonas sanguinis]KTW15660.1 phosphoserine phosphatase [Sphingomonas sanguinis]